MRGQATSALVLAAVVVGGCVWGDGGGESPAPLPAVPGVSGSPDGVHLYVANLDGSGIRRLTRGRSVSLGPVWAPSGRAIAVRTSRPREGTAPGSRPEAAIDIFAANGRHIRRIPATAGVGRVAWSPDSLRLAFVLTVDRPVHGPLNAAQLVVAQVGRGNGRTITERARPHAQDGPAWSPDGRRIAFQGHTAGRPPEGAPRGTTGPFWSELFVIDADGRNERRLTRGQSEESEPHWLGRDEMMFLQLRYPPGPRNARRLLAARADGGGQRTVMPGLHWSTPALSPDRRSIAMSAAVGEAGLLRLYVARVGGRPRRLVPDNVVERPTWSPDGKEIAFVTAGRIDAVRPDGSGRRTLLQLPGREIRDVAWSPDGKRIAFTTGTPIQQPPTRHTQPVQPRAPGSGD